MSPAVLLMIFWPLVCAITFAICIPVVRMRQAHEPDWNPQRFVFGVLVGVAAGVWRAGFSDDGATEPIAP